MPRIDTRWKLGGAEAAAVGGLLEAAGGVDGRRAIDVDGWVDLLEAGRDGLAGLIAWEGDRPVAYAQVARAGPGHEGGQRPARWTMTYVVDPFDRVPGRTAGEDIVAAAVDLIAAEGGGSVQMWLSQPRADEERAASAGGLSPARTLYQVRRPLPVEAALAGTDEPLATRPFRPGEDETAWLEVNNRAFAWHPEQGGWDLATIARRETEPWFDTAGFLLHEESGRLDGFCWTKVHAESEPVLGEIYVIAVDPDAGGHGLGRRLVLAGLDHLAGRGITVGMLYVDASNQGAVKLYVDMGFVVHHVDRAYTAVVPARPAAEATGRATP